jgi:hypothetical protein
MRQQRFLFALTALNVVLLVCLLAKLSPIAAQGPLPVLRGSALEIVDGQGRVRASITINPPTVVDSQAYPESVLLRMMSDPGGGPAVKLQASTRTTGLRLGDGTETGGVDLRVGTGGNFLAVTNPDGRQQRVMP